MIPLELSEVLEIPRVVVVVVAFSSPDARVVEAFCDGWRKYHMKNATRQGRRHVQGTSTGSLERRNRDRYVCENMIPRWALEGIFPLFVVLPKSRALL